MRESLRLDPRNTFAVGYAMRSPLGADAGLRGFSEIMPLEWSWLDWHHATHFVKAPKTEHHEGHGSRYVPMGEDLMRQLGDAPERAPEGTVRIFDRAVTNTAMDNRLAAAPKRIVCRLTLGALNVIQRWPFGLVVTFAMLTPFARASLRVAFDLLALVFFAAWCHVHGREVSIFLSQLQ